MRLSRRLVVFAFASLALGAGAVAAAPAGKAVAVNPSAADVVASGPRTLVVGADVGMGDKIVTGPTGQAQIIFNDDTHLVVGPSSALVIESYLLRGNKSVGQFAVNALGGTFRFITGQSDHSAYTIKTPTGTIGVRGTKFDFTVAPASGHMASLAPAAALPGTAVALFAGRVILCNRANSCVTLDRRCEAGWIQQPQSSTIGAFQAIDLGLRARFRYVDSQRPLLPEFRVSEADFCFIDTNAAPGGLSTPVGGGDNGGGGGAGRGPG